ncbi:methyltransferase, partial [Kingella kingae]|nr:methyltransferase [Kingella kingae]
PRAPQVQAALRDVFGTENSEPFLLPLNQLLGYIGAHEWHKKGVFVPALQHTIHVPFGVFSPIRGEYVDLVAKAACTFAPQSAMD